MSNLDNTFVDRTDGEKYTLQNTLADVDINEYMTEQGFVCKFSDFIERMSWTAGSYVHLFDRFITTDDFELFDRNFEERQEEAVCQRYKELLMQSPRYENFVGRCWGFRLEPSYDDSLSIAELHEPSKEVLDAVTVYNENTYCSFYKNVFFSVGQRQPNGAVRCEVHVILSDNRLEHCSIGTLVNNTILTLNLLEQYLWTVLQLRSKIAMTRDDRRRIIDEAIKQQTTDAA